MSINFEDDKPTITKDDLSNITLLAESVVANEKTVARIEEQLKQAKATLRQVQDRNLPEAMLACGMEPRGVMTSAPRVWRNMVGSASE